MFRRRRQDDIAPKSPPPPPSRLAQAKAASNARGLANQAEAAAAEERIQNHPDVLAKKAELERMVYEWAARLRFKINRIELNWGQYGSDFGREYSAFVIASSGDIVGARFHICMTASGGLMPRLQEIGHEGYLVVDEESLGAAIQQLETYQHRWDY